MDEGEATIRLHEQGNKDCTIGLNPVAAQAIEEYIDRAELTSAPLVRPRRPPRPAAPWGGDHVPGEIGVFDAPAESHERNHGQGRQAENTLHLDGAFAGAPRMPHCCSTATVDIRKVQDLLGHRHIYDKRRRGTSDGAIHLLVI
ncbi:MAG: hypothetical protein ABSF64_02355 [Bryobacteraceae bacterium]|jgi:hypothetical protein